MIKLILGQFSQAQLVAFQQAIDAAPRYQQRAIVMPYWGDREVQVVELPRKRCPRKMISIHAHTP